MIDGVGLEFCDQYARARGSGRFPPLPGSYYSLADNTYRPIKRTANLTKPHIETDKQSAYIRSRLAAAPEVFAAYKKARINE